MEVLILSEALPAGALNKPPSESQAKHQLKQQVDLNKRPAYYSDGIATHPGHTLTSLTNI